jgi:hypothetical protein
MDGVTVLSRIREWQSAGIMPPILFSSMHITRSMDIVLKSPLGWTYTDEDGTKFLVGPDVPFFRAVALFSDVTVVPSPLQCFEAIMLGESSIKSLLKYCPDLTYCGVQYVNNTKARLTEAEDGPLCACDTCTGLPKCPLKLAHFTVSHEDFLVQALDCTGLDTCCYGLLAMFSSSPSGLCAGVYTGFLDTPGHGVVHKFNRSEFEAGRIPGGLLFSISQPWEIWTMPLVPTAVVQKLEARWVFSGCLGWISDEDEAHLYVQLCLNEMSTR